jgi:hypothetical protein
MSNPIQGATRTIRDKDLEVETAIPAADSNADSNSLDLGGFSIAALEETEMKIEVPALGSLADSTSVTVTVQDSADDSTFATVDELSTLVVTGSGGTGSAADSLKVRLPSTTRRYLNVNIASDASSGDNTGSNVTFRLLS